AECNCKKTGYGIESKIPAGVRTEFQFQDTDTSEYSFGYDTGPENPSGHFRLEERMEDGSVRGRYGYTDPNGLLKIVEYFADDSGFHILNVKTQSPKAKQESKVIDHPEPFGPFLGVLPPFLQRYKSDLPSDNNKLDFAVNEI
ncbi:hypothetical protein BIW11_11524, partial [Tropilaelaps mercedesae]